MEKRMKVGFTSTIPVEVLFAAKCVPIDLNNYFISHPKREEFLQHAQRKGIPRTVCAWIKGIFATFFEAIDGYVFVEGGDCSNTIALREVAEFYRKRFYTFYYPPQPCRKDFSQNLDNFLKQFQISREDVEKVFFQLKIVREKLLELDRLTWEEGKVRGEENFLYLLQATDFEGDFLKYEEKLTQFLEVAKKRHKNYAQNKIRLAICGVPPIFEDLFSYLEDELGAYIVYNEIPLEFAILKGDSIEEAYTLYTYPYGMNYRLKTIERELEKRGVDGVIHYVQSFCYRNIEDIILKNSLSLPVLTLEGDESFRLTPRDKLRIENFVDMLR